MSNVLALISETPTKNQKIQFLTCNAANSKFPFMKNFISRILEYSEISIFFKIYVRYEDEPNYGFVQNNFLYATVVFTEPFTSYLVSSGDNLYESLRPQR